MSCGMKHPKAKKATKKAKPREKEIGGGVSKGEKRNFNFLLDIKTDFCYPFFLYYILS